MYKKYLFLILFPLLCSFPLEARQSDKGLFTRRFFEKPSQVGSLFPSSQALTKEMTRFCAPQCEGESRRILEIGAGTGVFTRKIIELMGPEDVLDIVELDPYFACSLRREFKSHKNVFIHEIDIVSFTQEEPYDVIVSGLPLNAFEPKVVDAILKKYISLSKKNGMFTYFDYPLIAGCKIAVSIGEKKRKFSHVLGLKKAFSEAYKVQSKIVCANFPPARVTHCKIQ